MVSMFERVAAAIDSANNVIFYTRLNEMADKFEVVRVNDAAASIWFSVVVFSGTGAECERERDRLRSRVLARAMLQALQRPTPAMVAAAEQLILPAGTQSGSYQDQMPDPATTWEVMVQVILDEIIKDEAGEIKSCPITQT